MEGKNVSFGTASILSIFHTSMPFALPAAIAAPKLVVSAIVGLTEMKTLKYYIFVHYQLGIINTKSNFDKVVQGFLEDL